MRWTDRIRVPEPVLAFIVIAVLFLAISGPVLDAGFVLNDDHEIISIASQTQVHPQTPVDSWQQRIFDEEVQRGRFRPLYYTSRFALAALLGANPLAWHVLFMLLGIVTVYLLYVSSRTIGVGFTPSLLFAGLVLLTRGVPVVWVRLGANETVGILFTAVALLALAKASNQRNRTSWDMLLVASALLASLSKESFVLILPAMTLVRLVLWRERWQQSYAHALRVLWPTLAVLVTLFAGLISAVIFVARSAGEVSEGGSGIAMGLGNFVKEMLATAPEAVVAGALFVPVGLAIATLLRRDGRERGDAALFLKAGMLCLLWVLPQMVLYRNRGGLLDRFTLPAAVPMAALNVVAILWLQNRGRSRAYWASAIWLAGWATLIFTYTTSMASHQRAEGLALNRMTSYVASVVPQGKKLVIVAEPAKHYEESISLLYFFGNAERSDMPIYLLPVPPEAAYNQEQSRLAERLIRSSFFANQDLNLLDPTEIGAIVYLAPKERIPKPQALQLGAVSWRRVGFAEPWFELGVRVRRLFHRTYVTFQTDIPSYAQ